MKTDISTLDQAVKTELENWANVAFKNAFNEAVEETAKEAVKRLKEGGPYQERTGKYTKDWTTDEQTSRTSAITGLKRYSVYNKKHYQLTHLLEKGHQTRDGKRTVQAFEHIGPVNDAIGEFAIAAIERKVRELT